jgi:hypothetical protein
MTRMKDERVPQKVLKEGPGREKASWKAQSKMMRCSEQGC